jgi:hypothetical protein
MQTVEKRTVQKQSSTKRTSVTAGDDTLMRILEDSEKYPIWPLNKALVIDWKMPPDTQLVMLFEKLEYYLENADN